MDKTVHSCELVFAYKEANWTKIKTNEKFYFRHRIDMSRLKS